MSLSACEQVLVKSSMPPLYPTNRAVYLQITTTALRLSHLRLTVWIDNALLVGGEAERHVGGPVGVGDVVGVAHRHVENIRNFARDWCLR